MVFDFISPGVIRTPMFCECKENLDGQYIRLYVRYKYFKIYFRLIRLQEEKMSSKAVTRMSELINAGRWKQAVLIAEHAEKDPSFQPDAHFYIQWALVKRLLGQDTETQLERARASSGYNELMAGDIIRDAALGLLREGNPDEAERTLAGAYEYHQGNTNRMAALLMSEARIHFARSQYALARSAHERAYRMWRTAPDADRQWVMKITSTGSRRTPLSATETSASFGRFTRRIRGWIERSSHG